MQQYRINRKTIQLFLLSFFLIYIIFEPPYTQLLFNIHPYYINVIIGIIMLIYGEICHKKIFDKRTIKGIIVISFCAIYILLLSWLCGNNIRFFQHIYFIFQIVPLYFINHWVDKNFEDAEQKKIELTKAIVVIEAVICVLMIISPQIRQHAIDLYSLGDSANINKYVISVRIYGIYGDYTYKSQIMSGMFAFWFAYYGFTTKNWKMFLYVALALFTSVLNGRTGTLVFLVCAILFAISLLFTSSKINVKLLKFEILVSIVAVLTFMLLNIFLPGTAKFLINMFMNLAGKAVGSDNNLGSLVDSLRWPHGLQFLFGTGTQLYGRKVGASDIGFCNDVFLMGALMTLIEYSAIFYLILPRGITKDNKIFSFCLFIAIMMANFKGVCMRNGAVIVGVLWIRLCMNSHQKVIKENEECRKLVY